MALIAAKHAVGRYLSDSKGKCFIVVPGGSAASLAWVNVCKKLTLVLSFRAGSNLFVDELGIISISDKPYSVYST